MKILLSHRYFWPDTSPYATMLRSIAGRLASEGHDVTVFSSKPSYHASDGVTAASREELDGFKVVRMPIFRERKGNLPMRAVNVLAYALGVWFHILKTRDYDVVTAATFPPIAAAKMASLAARWTGAKFLYHFQDIHPELSLYSGQVKRGRFFRFLQNLDSKTCRKADALVVLSSDMANVLKERPGNAHLQPAIINNFLLESFNEDKAESELNLPKDKFTILFAGNIGRFQNLDTIIKAAHELKHEPSIQFWFVGEGVAKKRLIKQAGDLIDQTVFFLPHQHHSIAQKLMGQANFNLVSLMPDIYRVAYPSKTLAILARGTPVLAVIEEESELGQMVNEEKIGYATGQSDPKVIARIIEQAYRDGEMEAEFRINAGKLYKARFAKDKILDQWCDIFKNL